MIYLFLSYLLNASSLTKDLPLSLILGNRNVHQLQEEFTPLSRKLTFLSHNNVAVLIGLNQKPQTSQTDQPPWTWPIELSEALSFFCKMQWGCPEHAGCSLLGGDTLAWLPPSCLLPQIHSMLNKSLFSNLFMQAYILLKLYHLIVDKKWGQKVVSKNKWAALGNLMINMGC